VDGNNANHADSNLASLCKQCHGFKTVKHDGGFGREITRIVTEAATQGSIENATPT
jgi:hypothetical protein